MKNQEIAQGSPAPPAATLVIPGGAASSDAPPPQPPLRAAVFRSSFWTLVSYGGQQALRFAGNLVLTRLLAPEHFGLMTLIAALVQGLQMFSDVGIGPSIIQNKRGDEPAFLNSAWTIQVIRGCALWVVSLAIAYPFAAIWGPELAVLVPVAAFTTVLSGLNSTNLISAGRHLALGRASVIELLSYVLGLTATIVWAWYWGSVWSLVAGSLATAWLRAIMTHAYLPGIRNRLWWDAGAIRELVRFGRWIFLSTILGFIASQGDKLILGLFLTASQLGVYSVAFYIAMFAQQLMQQLLQRVAFPAYAKAQDAPRSELLRRVRKVRLTLMATMLPLLSILVLFGQPIIDFLYDPRYHSGGWMVQVLAAGGMVGVVLANGPIFLALGKSHLQTIMLAFQSVGLLGGMFLGGWLGGEVGLIVGIGAAKLLVYPLQAVMWWRQGVWQPRLDALGFCATGAVWLLALALHTPWR